MVSLTRPFFSRAAATDFVRAFFLAAKKSVFLPESEMTGAVFAEIAPVAFVRIRSATGTFADAFLFGREKRLRAGDGLIRLRKLPHKSGDAVRKAVRGKLSALHFFEAALPFGGQHGRLQCFRQDGDQRGSDRRGDKMGYFLGLFRSIKPDDTSFSRIAARVADVPGPFRSAFYGISFAPAVSIAARRLPSV